ncbi:MAG: hypothetical protein SWN10_16130 [Pseudomonadota bacterium]|nr:hypothetical protein [Alteromonadaceae bacterium]MDY6928615.1 hypothetical protein [Pseudomonadota bacterium]RPH23690.1 MAG: hypothetical protein CBB67_000135 [Alteromonadaceae bacterium TMED7]|tara:strand:+ start:7235 stop:7441 length:207 start_codon:yes stop_codon:yes gene_type:complete
MGAISLLEKLGVDPSLDMNNLSPAERAELEQYLATIAQEENNPTLSIYDPTDPDDDDNVPSEEPAKDA